MKKLTRDKITSKQIKDKLAAKGYWRMNPQEYNRKTSNASRKLIGNSSVEGKYLRKALNDIRSA